MTFLKISALSVVMTFLALFSQAATGTVDNTIGCDVEVTITYVCNGQTYTKTFTATKAQPTNYTIPNGCCVVSADFEYGSSGLITLTGVGYDCAEVCDQDLGSCQDSCTPLGLTGKTCITWIDNGVSGCENAPDFGIGCGCF